MSSGQGFDYGSCIVLGSIVEDSPEFCECGAVEGRGCIWGSVVVARVGGLQTQTIGARKEALWGDL